MRWQAVAFRTGVLAVVPRCVLALFTAAELRKVWGGEPIGPRQLADWRAHTVYKFGLSAESVEARWFWAVLEAESEDFRAAVLKFATGTQRAPVDGFANLRKGEKDGARCAFTLFGTGTDSHGP